MPEGIPTYVWKPPHLHGGMHKSAWRHTPIFVEAWPHLHGGMHGHISTEALPHWHGDIAMHPCRCEYVSKEMWPCFYTDEGMLIAQMAMPSCRYGHVYPRILVCLHADVGMLPHRLPMAPCRCGHDFMHADYIIPYMQILYMPSDTCGHTVACPGGCRGASRPP